MMGRVLVSAVADVTDLTAKRGVWDCGSCEEFPISRPRATPDERMAGVWGEASPQAPPEGAGGARNGGLSDRKGRGMGD